MQQMISTLLATVALTLALLMSLGASPAAAGRAVTAPAITDSGATTASLRASAVATTTLWLPLIVGGNARDDAPGGSTPALDTTITFNGDAVTIEGNGVIANGNVFTITTAGTYGITGTLNDGQLVVATNDTEAVELVLKGFHMTNSTGAPLYIRSTAQTTITLATGTQNSLTDAEEYLFADGEEEPDAALFSQGDLVIQGDGALTVNANYNDGIAGQAHLTVTGGTIAVTAANHAIQGKDSITILDGTFALNAGNDGMQADQEDDPTLGYITIANGTFDITAVSDAIQAETALTVDAGNFMLVSGGGSSVIAEESAKGLKAGAELIVTGGTFNIDATDDAVHSDNILTINGGTFTLATADDAIHADATIIINGGVIRITESLEGIEGAYVIINDGEIHLTAADDGINAAGDTEAPGSYYVEINGGYIAIDANGDGLDANGVISMNGGTLLINGPTVSDNGAIDYESRFTMSGGLLVAVGSAAMAQAPDATSTHQAVLINLSTTQAAGTMFHMETAVGGEILTFVPTKAYQSVAFSSPALANGTAYNVYTGGTSTGTATDGLYTGGSYTPGTQVTTFTISNTITTVDTTGDSSESSN